MKRVFQCNFHINTPLSANICIPAKATSKLFMSLSYNMRVALAEAAKLPFLKWSSPSYHRVFAPGARAGEAGLQSYIAVVGHSVCLHALYMLGVGNHHSRSTHKTHLWAVSNNNLILNHVEECKHLAYLAVASDHQCTKSSLCMCAASNLLAMQLHCTTHAQWTCCRCWQRLRLIYHADGALHVLYRAGQLCLCVYIQHALSLFNCSLMCFHTSLCVFKTSSGCKMTPVVGTHIQLRKFVSLHVQRP